MALLLVELAFELARGEPGCGVFVVQSAVHVSVIGAIFLMSKMKKKGAPFILFLPGKGGQLFFDFLNAR